MNTNAYILSRTINDFDRLLVELNERGFAFQKEAGNQDIRLSIPFVRWEEFADLVQPKLNRVFNYVDIDYPEKGKKIIIFGIKRWVILSKAENEVAKEWAINLGLPREQAKWVYFDKTIE